MSQAISKQLIPDGYKSTEIGVIPDDWDVFKINQIGSIRVGGDVNFNAFSSEQDYIYQYPIYSNTVDILGIYGYYNFPEYSTIAVTVVGRGVGLGTAIVRDSGFGAIGRLIVITPNKSNEHFIAAYINQYVEIFNESSGVPQLTGIALGNKLIPLPSLAEQTAIANALSNVDLLLNELEKLISKKQAIKTATMQQLLTGKTRLPQFAYFNSDESTEGELKNKAIHQTSSPTSSPTTGITASQGKKKGTKPSELGEIPEDWEVYPLHKIIASNQLGGNYANSESETEFPLIKMGNLGRGQIKLKKIEYVIGKVSQRDRLKYGDVLFNTRNTLELVGKVAIWRNEMPEAYFNSNILRLKFDKCIVASNEYINAVMNTRGFVTDLANVATGTTSVAAIYTRDLFQLNLLLPPKEEQTAIATILSDMDEEIQALTKRLSKTRQIKQGMMQELLTGKTRLPFEKLEVKGEVING